MICMGVLKTKQNGSILWCGVLREFGVTGKRWRVIKE